MPKETEKYLDRKLVNEVKKAGGWAIKLVTTHISGLPDRLCLFPGGVFKFVEMKGTGQEPTKLQLVVHSKLRRLGFEVLVCDSSEKINGLLKWAQIASDKLLE